MRATLATAAAVLVLWAGGCAEKRTVDARPQLTPAARGGTSSDTPRYERYHALWWISHSDLEDSVGENRDTRVVEEKFERTVASLKSMGKFLVETGKQKMESVVDEYERLRVAAETEQAARRVVAGLNKVKNRVTRYFAPQNAGPHLKKDH